MGSHGASSLISKGVQNSPPLPPTYLAENLEYCSQRLIIVITNLFSSNLVLWIFFITGFKILLDFPRNWVLKIVGELCKILTG